MTTTYAHEYTEKILHRGRVFMEPVDFTPNWADKPRKQKYYPDTVPIPLSRGTIDPTGDLDTAVHGDPGDQPFDLTALGEMLQDSYGLIGRRLAVQANTDLPGLPRYVDANWCRGTASGGGLYPISVYVVAGPTSGLLPGIYHYSPATHALHRLLTGDVSGDVRRALGGGADDTDTFVVLGLKYWQNAFKYNSFSFHAVTMDLGTVVATWTAWAQATGRRIDARLWFDEPALAELLGVDNAKEGVYAAIPLRQRTGPRHTPPTSATAAAHDHELSRVSYGFDAVERMQADTAAEALDAPSPDALAEAGPTRRCGEVLPLPIPTPLSASVRTAVRRRRSSFGRFVGRPLGRRDLTAVLSAAAKGGIRCEAGDSSELVSLYVFVNHVESVPRGAYRYDPSARTLTRIALGDQGRFLQDNYFLSNYNLEQAGVVIVPTIRTHAVLDAVGARGYRLVNATIGAVSQLTYTACAALNIGCGVALGFDNISFIERLGLETSGEKPLLVMAVGHERGLAANFRSPLV